MEKNLKLNLKLFKMSEIELMEYLKKKYDKLYWDVVATDDYLFLCGGGKVLINCHLDVVYSWSLKGNDKVYYVDGYIWSPLGCGGDDRCGVQIAKWYIDNAKYAKHCDFLFTRGEEKGLKGARAFVAEWGNVVNYLALIGLDRERDGFVLYQYEYDKSGLDWRLYIEKITGRKCERGSASDISAMTSLKTKGVNLGVGYCNNHTGSGEYVVVRDMYKCYYDLKKLVKDLIDKNVKWEHIEELVIDKWQYRWQYDRWNGKNKWDWYWKDELEDDTKWWMF